MANQVADFLPKLINQYCPAMTYAADVHIGGATRVSLGTPAVGDVDAFILATGMDLDGTAATVLAANFQSAGNAGVMDAPYGRNVTISASGAAGAECLVTVTGRDYLGQPMTEVIAIAASGTSFAGKKAFKYVDSIAHAGTASNAVTGGAGFGDVLGLPYKCVKILSEEADGAVEGTLGTLVTPVLTDPATSTTGDPRGTYNPQTTLDGSKEITITAIFDATINSSGNGGLHGIAHYSA